MNATQGGANLHPGVNLLPGANLHPGANCAHEHGFRLLFQEFFLLFYVEYFNELLRYFLGVQAVYHDVLSDNGLFRPMYSEEILVSLSVANGV